MQRLKLKKEKNLLHKKFSRKRKEKQQKGQMYTQILSKNELVRMDVVNTEKRKEKQKVQLSIPTNTPALSKKQNKWEGKKSMKTTERKVKSER